MSRMQLNAAARRIMDGELLHFNSGPTNCDRRQVRPAERRSSATAGQKLLQQFGLFLPALP